MLCVNLLYVGQCHDNDKTRNLLFSYHLNAGDQIEESKQEYKTHLSIALD